MKSMKKIIVAASLCAAIGATAIAGTLAYFTDTTDTEKNTFTAGDVDITLTEPVWDDTDKTPKDENGDFVIVPGEYVVKDPTVTLSENSIASYVRVVVTMPSEIYAKSNLNANFEQKLFKFTMNGDELDPATVRSENLVEGTVTLYFDTTLVPGGVYTPFNIIEFDGAGITNSDDLYEVLKDFDIDVTAYAVQQSGFDTAEQAFADAFEQF